MGGRDRARRRRPLPASDVDPARIAIVGLEHGGFGVARALAHERRLAAALLIPGSSTRRRHGSTFSRTLHEALLDRDPDLFEQELHLAALFSPGIIGELRRAANWFDPGDLSLYELYAHISGSRLDAEIGQIKIPTSLYEPKPGNCWAGQTSELAGRLGQIATLTRGPSTDEAVLRWLNTLFPMDKGTMKLQAPGVHLRPVR